MSGHRYLRTTVPVEGGELAVGVWEPEGETTDTVLAIHGVTSSHLIFPFLARALPGVRVIAPDLRGRGRSCHVEGPAGMAAHARDMAAVLRAFDLDRPVVVGHSMGGFVSVVLSHLYPHHVGRLVLVDGGMPLPVPDHFTPEEIVAAVLGPTAERLSMRFASVDEYLARWRQHPAFVGDFTPELEAYVAYDLEPDGDLLRPATSYRVTVEDTEDLVVGAPLHQALGALSHPTRLLTVDLGLTGEPPGLYPPEYLAAVLEAIPQVRHERVHGPNHYTIVISEEGAAAVAAAVLDELDANAQARAQV